MLQNNENIDYLTGLLPKGAIIVTPLNIKETSPIKVGDLDQDGNLEAVIPYKLSDEYYLMVLKKYNEQWYSVFSIKGKGIGINYLDYVDFEGNGIKDIVVGWQEGAIWSELNIFTWKAYGLKRIVKELNYSILQVFPVANTNRKDFAIWQHDTGEAYKIEVFCKKEDGIFKDKGIYKDYFKMVVRYYEKKVKEMPDAAFYWYYLGDAQIKAGENEAALKSIKKGINLNREYPSKEAFLILKDRVQRAQGKRNIIGYVSSELYPASVRTIEGIKWGYINNTGQLVIKPDFQSSMDFQDNGLAIVSKNDNMGVINGDANFVIDPQYDYIEKFREGIAIANNRNGYYAFSDTGKKIFQYKNYIGNFNEGKATFVEIGIDSQWIYGYVDKNGKVVIAAKYEVANNFNNDKAVVKLVKGPYEIIDPKGNTIQSFKYPFVGDISEGLLIFKEKSDGKFGYINEKGGVVIEPKFGSAEPFKNGSAVINLSTDFENKYGLIDKNGSFIIQPIYNNIKLLGEDMVAVGKAIDKNNPPKGSIYALANIKGKIITDFIYYEIDNYNGGIASAYDNSHTFFIDKSGEIISVLPKVKGTGTLTLENGLVKADIDNRISYLDKKGTVLWKQNSDVELNDLYKIQEIKYNPNRNYLVYYPKVLGIKDAKRQRHINEKIASLAQVKKIDPKKQLDYNYFGDFSIEFFNKQLVVLELSGYNYPFGAAHGMPTLIYVHVGLKDGKIYSLEELFKKNSHYVRVLSDIIKKQIEAQGSDSDIWLDEYKGIKRDQPFFISQDVLNIYFYPYEIAPYAAGFPTFHIPFTEIENIIDTKGVFWRSFN
ncbi:WG repeat-containing protein [Clostridium pasteurianum]|uniref:KWG repeat protein n=1 Tax=Clostridium pasteurianum BC1 TaxID=86416 RepID=R4KE40_CLOPA|nr:WG repeat-containing protein [Clostridium pasteurianum]AGK98819.1 KWG repeat protein [Clostridium pasteurianum BC1]